MSTLIVDFTLNVEAREDALDIPGVCIYGAGGIDPTIEDGTIVVRFKEVDEVLLESMTADELIEFLGIDAEYLIAMEVVNLV
jgi:hypothetical protein